MFMSKINKKLQLENKIAGKTLAASQTALHRPGLAQPWHQNAPDVLLNLEVLVAGFVLQLHAESSQEMSIEIIAWTYFNYDHFSCQYVALEESLINNH